jgi:hypothetical protein
VLLKWHWGLDPARFIESGEEPDLGYAALAHPANIASKVS